MDRFVKGVVISCIAIAVFTSMYAVNLQYSTAVSTNPTPNWQVIDSFVIHAGEQQGFICPPQTTWRLSWVMETEENPDFDATIYAGQLKQTYFDSISEEVPSGTIKYTIWSDDGTYTIAVTEGTCQIYIEIYQ